MRHRPAIVRTIRAKLASSFGVVLVLLLGLAGVAWWGLSGMTSVTRTIDGSVTPRMIAVDDLRATASDAHFSETRAVLDATAGAKKDYEGDNATFMATKRKLDAVAGRGADAAAIARIDAAAAHSNAVATKMFGLLAAGHPARAAAMLDAADEASDGVVEALTAYQKTLRGREASLAGRASSTSSHARWAIVLVAVAAVAAAAALATTLTRRLGRRTHRLLAAAEGISLGELEHDVSTENLDEIGDATRAFGRMITYLRDLAEAVTRVADGDLTVQVVPQSEHDVLATAVARMVDSLRGVISEVSGAATHLSAASEELTATSSETSRAVDEIARAVDDVAEGAERQVRHGRDDP